MGDGQTTWSRISREMAKSQGGGISWEMAKSHGRAFHRRCQITGSRISKEMPNHRVAHFTGDAKSRGRAFHRRCQITWSRISEGRAKSQGRVFQRVVPNHRVGISQGRAKSQGRQITGWGHFRDFTSCQSNTRSSLLFHFSSFFVWV